MTGSKLYQDAMAYYEANNREPELNHKVWDGTLWIVDAYTGRVNEDRWHAMNQWCRDRFGPEAWPNHGEPGQWHKGGATIHGWTWFGFATEEQMKQFVEAWPPPDCVAAPEEQSPSG